MDKDKKINFVIAIILTGFMCSVCFHYIKGYYFHLPYPHNTFLFTPGDKFADYFNILNWNKDLNPYFQNVATAQYPLLNFLSYLLSLINRLISFCLYNAVVISLFCYLNAIALDCKDKIQLYIRTFVFSFLTYPFLFTIDRGNFESLLCVFLMLFIYFYQQKKYIVSTLFLAFAISMKLFPVFLVVLLIAEKKYRQLLFAILFVAGITLLCLATFSGGLEANLRMLISGANLQNNSNVLSFTGNNTMVQRGVTLFTFCKVIFCQLDVINRIDMVRFLAFYKVVMLFFSCLLSFYVVFVEKEFWKRVAVLVFMMLLFPQISADYKLIHIVIPLLLFINAVCDQKFDLFYTVMFSLLMIPKDYLLLYCVSSDAGTNDISIAVLLNPIIMIAMMAVIVITGIRRTSWPEILILLQEHLEKIGLQRLYKNKSVHAS